MVVLLLAVVTPACAQVSYLGSFMVKDGPEPPSLFQPNNPVPAVYSCVEACQVMSFLPPVSMRRDGGEALGSRR